MRNHLRVLAWAGLMCAVAGCESASRAYIDPSDMGRPTANAREVVNETEKTKNPSVVPLLAIAAADTQVAAAPQRIVIYTAGLRLTVQDVRQTIDSVRAFAVAAGGYMQDIDDGSITVRVPAAKFDSTLEQIGRLGEVTQRQIKASDITEEMHDLNLRLDNAVQVRARLVALLDKSQKMEDTLAIEKEMARLSETIEMLKGKIRFLESQAAMSTIRVIINSPLPQKDLVEQIPFAWVRQIGDGLLSGQLMPAADRGGFFKAGTSFKLPPAYVRYFEDDDRTEAMSADGVLIKLQRHDNYDGGELAFWGKLVRRAMVDNRGLAVTGESDVTFKSGADAHVISGSREIAGRPFGYTVATISNNRRVYTFEAWGPIEEFKKDRDSIAKSIESLDISK